MTSPYVDPSSLVPPLLPGAKGVYPYRPLMSGRVTAWNATTLANTTVVGGTEWPDLPVCTAAIASIVAGTTVLVAPFEDGYVIVDKLRIP